MKTLKKWIAFMLAAGLIVSAVKITAVTVLAEEEEGEDYYYQEFSPSNTDHYYEPILEDDDNEIYQYKFIGALEPTRGNDDTEGNSDTWFDDGSLWYPTDGTEGYYIFTDDGADGIWVLVSTNCDGDSSSAGDSSSDCGSSSSSCLTPEEAIANAASQAEAAAVNHAAGDEGFENAGDMYRAAEQNMSAGEYYNNVVISTPGIENAVTVGQGGNIVVNGEVTNMTAMISKVTNRAYVDSVRVNEPEGRVLNVVGVSYPGFDATINFYMPSVTVEMDVVALQYNAGTWENVDVVEVREDHVVLNMKKSGVVAFVAK